MKTKARIISLIMASVIMLSLCSCGKLMKLPVDTPPGMEDNLPSDPLPADKPTATFVFQNKMQRELKSVGITWLDGNEWIASAGMEHADGSPLQEDEDIVFEVAEDEIPEYTDYADFGFRLRVVDSEETAWEIVVSLPLEINKKYTFSMGLVSGQLYLTHDYETEPTVSTASYDLTGPWHLDETRCTGTDLSELFPGFAEWGSSMEIRSDGLISWYIGAESWSGTYRLDTSGMIAQMKSDLENTEKEWKFTLLKPEEATILVMQYEDHDLVWSYGEQEDPPTDDRGEEKEQDTSIRVFYQDAEIEYGLVDMTWIVSPLDAGTRHVLEDGYKVLFASHGIDDVTIEMLLEKGTI